MWRPHIVMYHGFYRVFWRNVTTNVIYPADMVPYKQRSRQTKAAVAFVASRNATLNRGFPPANFDDLGYQFT